MNENNIYILDSETVYLTRLSKQLTLNSNSVFGIRSFTDKEKMLSSVEKKGNAIFLIAEKDFDGPLSENETIRGSFTVILKENNMNNRCISLPGINKYQSASGILNDVFLLYSETSNGKQTFSPVKNKMRHIGIMDTGNCGKDALFAFSLASVLSERSRVIYIDITPFCAYPEISEGNDTNSLSELLYYLEKEDPDIISRISSCTVKYGSLDVIPPVRMLEDLAGITIGKICSVIKSLDTGSVYDHLVMNLDPHADDLISLLNIFEKVLIPSSNTYLMRRKTEKICSYPPIRDNEALKSILRKINLPDSFSLASPHGAKEEILYGSIGRYIRSVIEKEGI